MDFVLSGDFLLSANLGQHFPRRKFRLSVLKLKTPPLSQYISVVQQGDLAANLQYTALTQILVNRRMHEHSVDELIQDRLITIICP